MDDMKIAKSMEESSLLMKGVNKTIKSRAKEKIGFSSIIVSTLIASLLGYLLTGKGVKAKILLQGKTRTGQKF